MSTTNPALNRLYRSYRWYSHAWKYSRLIEIPQYSTNDLCRNDFYFPRSNEELRELAIHNVTSSFEKK